MCFSSQYSGPSLIGTESNFYEQGLSQNQHRGGHSPTTIYANRLGRLGETCISNEGSNLVNDSLEIKKLTAPSLVVNSEDAEKGSSANFSWLGKGQNETRNVILNFFSKPPIVVATKYDVDPLAPPPQVEAC